MNLFVSAHQLYGVTKIYTRVVQVKANRNIQKYPSTVILSFVMLTKDKKPGLILKISLRKFQVACIYVLLQQVNVFRQPVNGIAAHLRELSFSMDISSPRLSFSPRNLGSNPQEIFKSHRKFMTKSCRIHLFTLKLIYWFFISF